MSSDVIIAVVLGLIAIFIFTHFFSKPKACRPKIVGFKAHIALDFGTSGCGLAFAYTDENNEKKMDTYDRFSCGNRRTTNKTKTCILINDKGEVVSFGSNAKFIYERAQKDIRQRWRYFDRFKMALYDDKLSQSSFDLPDEKEEKKQKKEKKFDIKRTIPAMNGQFYKSEDVFVAAFQHLGKIAKPYLDKTLKKMGVKIKTYEIQWILTVPAIWSDKSKDLMRKWIIKAGLVSENIKDQCLIVYEPECASLTIKKEVTKLRPGQRYILVDAGGGTVDIACHEILTDDDVKEIMYPTGGKWGGCYIDDAYIKLLQQLFTEKYMDEFKEKDPSCYVETIGLFEDAKKLFWTDKQTNDKWHSIRLPYQFLQFLESKFGDKGPERQVDKFEVTDDIKSLISMQQESNTKSLKSKPRMKSNPDVNCALYVKIRAIEADDYTDDADRKEFLDLDIKIWRALFDSKINPIISHVDELWNLDSLREKCNYLCLVGGFSGSKYFQWRMEQHFGPKSKYRMEIIVPKSPKLAVVQGAALMGIYKNYVKERKLKYTYGVETILHVKKAEKSGVPTNWITHHTSYDGKVDGCFGVVAGKNDSVVLDEKREKEYTSTGKERKITILSSDKENPKTKNDAIELGTVTVSGAKKGEKIVVEFHFGGTEIIVYSYPKGMENLKKEVTVDYGD